MHYEQLPQIYKQLKPRGLEILAFPCNQFNSQEPKSHAKILEFTSKRGVTFPIFAKVNVNGSMFSNKGVEPLYVWMKKKAPGSVVNAVKWNFTKFLCDHNGVPIRRYAPNKEPVEMVADIEALLDAREAALGPYKPPAGDAASAPAAGPEAGAAGSAGAGAGAGAGSAAAPSASPAASSTTVAAPAAVEGSGSSEGGASAL